MSLSVKEIETLKIEQQEIMDANEYTHYAILFVLSLLCVSISFAVDNFFSLGITITLAIVFGIIWHFRSDKYNKASAKYWNYTDMKEEAKE